MYFIVIACLVATASAAKFCCSPDQWEADVSLVMGTRKNGTGQFVQGIMEMAYDSVNKIVTSNQTLTVNGNTLHQRLVSDYKNNILYTIRPTSCSKQSLGGWIPFCIPDNATESSNSRYGLGAESLQVKTYYIDYVNYDVYMSVTDDTCAPVAEDVIGQSGEAEVVYNMVFANIKPGIADRNVFQVPSQCDDAPLFNAANSVLGRRATFF